MPSEVIVSPDTQNEESKAKDQVEDIREAINGEATIAIATAEQLQNTSDVRKKVNEAVQDHTYANGRPVPADINVKLNARKEDEDPVVALIVGNGSHKEMIAETNEKSEERVEASVKRVLSNPSEDSASHQDDSKNQPENVDTPWKRHHPNQIFLKTPSFSKTFSDITFPILRTLKQDFVGKFFSVPKKL